PLTRSLSPSFLSQVSTTRPRVWWFGGLQRSVTSSALAKTGRRFGIFLLCWFLETRGAPSARRTSSWVRAFPTIMSELSPLLRRPSVLWWDGCLFRFYVRVLSSGVKTTRPFFLVRS